jgi:hypothetical protein
MNFYVTFGQKYRRERHESGIMVDPDAVFPIDADDRKGATEKTRTLFGLHYHNIYDEAEWQKAKHFYPHGVERRRTDERQGNN